jgi:hypothetical protein
LFSFLESNPSKFRRLSLFVQALIRNGLKADNVTGYRTLLVAFEKQMIGRFKTS